jgi:hypothetical protein
MLATATRLWAIPLTAVLSVNILLVGVAFRHVGAAAETEQLVSDAPSAATPTGTTSNPSEALAQPSPSETLAVAAPTTDSGLFAEGDLAGSPVVDAWGDESATVVSPVVIGNLPNLTASEIAADAARVDEPNSDLNSLILINPPATGGVVHFVVDGQVLSLAPGELRRLPAGVVRRVQFHRGGKFGDADQRCQSGVFAFSVNEHGWSLGEIDGQAAGRLLKLCVPAKAVSGEW